MERREHELFIWVASNLEVQEKDLRIVKLVGDASFRKYYRAYDDYHRSYIVMDAIPSKENCSTFVQVDNTFAELGLNVPTIYRQNLEQGFLLLEDFGGICYLDQLSNETMNNLYNDAFDALLLLQAAKPVAYLDYFDKNKILVELNLFNQWFLQQHLAIDLVDTELKLIDEIFNILISSALEQPQVMVHRDYHSRNLMITEVDNPGILDFQDAVIGPITYDLASLLRDAYIVWPTAMVDSLVLTFKGKLEALGILDAGVSEKQFMRWFDLIGLQRHLKILGIFTRLYHRDCKEQYLNDIPKIVDYINLVLVKYQELNAFYEFFNHRVLKNFDKEEKVAQL